MQVGKASKEAIWIAGSSLESKVVFIGSTTNLKMKGVDSIKLLRCII